MFATKINLARFYQKNGYFWGSLALAFFGIGTLSACQTQISESTSKSLNQPQPAQIEQTRLDDTPTPSRLSHQIGQYRWQLAQAQDKNAQNLAVFDAVIAKNLGELSFLDQRLTASVGCNRLASGYQLTGDHLTIGQMISTKKLCQSLMPAENALAKALAGKLKVQFQNMDKNDTATLTLTTETGDRLVWQGTKTPEARYQSPAQTLFFYIKADGKKPCPDQSDRQCLQAKPIYYDKNGLKQSEGDWQWLNRPIEGYQHNPNANQILRIKRFIVDRPDVKGKIYADVLDMIVMTESIPTQNSKNPISKNQ